MKKKYVAPETKVVLFETDCDIMDGETDIGSGGGDFSGWPDDAGRAYYTYGAGNTVVNNNGTPTVIPGGNGGGRQTPLG